MILEIKKLTNVNHINFGKIFPWQENWPKVRR